MSPLSVREAGNLEAKCQQDLASSAGSGETPSLPLLACLSWGPHPPSPRSAPSFLVSWSLQGHWSLDEGPPQSSMPCDGLNVRVLSQSHVRPKLQCAAVRKGGLWEVLRSSLGQEGIHVLIRSRRRSDHSTSLCKEQSRSRAYTPRRLPSTTQEVVLNTHQILQHLDLGVVTSRTARSKCLLLSTPIRGLWLEQPK